MGKQKSNILFNFISPIYGLFYNSQKNNFEKIINEVEEDIDLTSFNSIIDVGCGTGALCSVLHEKGLSVTGIDSAKFMLNTAIRKNKGKDIKFLSANILDKLPFDDNSFDISIASYVAHGLQSEERKKMYAEMSRISKEWVIIHDYNKKRSLLTSIIEWMEGGDYFRFIKTAELEMKNCISEIKECFSEVKVINVSEKANWYLCKPNNK